MIEGEEGSCRKGNRKDNKKEGVAGKVKEKIRNR